MIKFFNKKKDYKLERFNKEYFEFIKKFDSYNYINESISNPLLSRYEFKVADKTISFNSFNVSWISRRKETQAQLFYPVNNIDMDTLINANCNYNITLFHHPFHWLNHMLYLELHLKH